MGGIFGKNKRLRVFPKRVVLYKAKGKTTSGTVRMFCDASTWTGENHIHSARIGRTPKGPEFSAAKLDAPESKSERERGERAASLRAQQTEAPLAVAAGDAQNVEVSGELEAKPSADVKHHQELTERRTPEGQEGRQGEAVPHPAGSWTPNEQLGSEDDQATPLTQTTVKAEVHVSVGVRGGSGEVQSATVESELPAGAEQEAGAVSAAEETRVGRTQREVPVQEAAEPPAAPCAMEESELPLEATETREDTTSVQRSVEEQVCCAAEALPDLQLEPDTEAPITEDREESAFEPEQAEVMAEVCDDGQTSKESK